MTKKEAVCGTWAPAFESLVTFCASIKTRNLRFPWELNVYGKRLNTAPKNNPERWQLTLSLLARNLIWTRPPPSLISERLSTALKGHLSQIWKDTDCDQHRFEVLVRTCAQVNEANSTNRKVDSVMTWPYNKQLTKHISRFFTSPKHRNGLNAEWMLFSFVSKIPSLRDLNIYQILIRCQWRIEVRSQQSSTWRANESVRLTYRA